jgi:hypothetical protein
MKPRRRSKKNPPLREGDVEVCDGLTHEEVVVYGRNGRISTKRVKVPLEPWSPPATTSQTRPPVSESFTRNYVNDEFPPEFVPPTHKTKV